jgi:hypothetical protein
MEVDLDLNPMIIITAAFFEYFWVFYSTSVYLYRYGISHTVVQKSVQDICHNTTSKFYIDT